MTERLQSTLAGGGKPGRGSRGYEWMTTAGARAAAAALFLALIVTFLFRASYSYGMNYDEVFRLNPLISLVNPEAAPLDQAIYSFEVGSLRIPLMLKSYISSLTSIHFLPALLFDDPRFGLRALYPTYLWLACFLLFLFLVRYGFLFALGAATLLATAPHLYPEIRFGFASVVHVILLTAAALAWRRASEGGRLLLWFLGGAAAGLALNLRGYAVWTFGGLFLGALLLFPRQLVAHLRAPRSLLTASAGFLLGGANYVVFNVATRGGTFRPFLIALFRRDEYNRDPVDYRQLPDLSVELSHKLAGLYRTFGAPGADTLSFLGLVSVATGLFLGLGFKFAASPSHREQLRGILFPFAALALIFCLIFLTPKSGRAGHWAYLSPLLEISLMAAPLYLWRTAKRGYSARRIAAISLGSLIALASFVVANAEVSGAVRSQGDGLFSPMIYEVAADVNLLDRDEYAVATVDWGFWSQLYFLSRGEAPLYELTFQLLAAGEEGARDLLGDFLVKQHALGRRILFLHGTRPHLGATLANFSGGIERLGGELEAWKLYFRSPGGSAVYVMSLLANDQEIIQRVCGTGADGSGPQILEYGPREVFDTQAGDLSGIWIRLEEARSRYSVSLDGRPKPITLNAGNVLTFPVSSEDLMVAGSYPVRVCDPCHDTCAEVFLKVRTEPVSG